MISANGWILSMLFVSLISAPNSRAGLEKVSLTREIQSPSTLSVRKQRATLRYPSVDAELRINAGELENFIAAAKRAHLAGETVKRIKALDDGDRDAPK
jgi:hypothetical protein